MDHVEHSLGRGGDATFPSASGGEGGRLNLLISWAAWRPDSWVDSLPPLLAPLGVNSVRASSAREAEQCIRRMSVHVAVVDLGLPMECGVPGGGGLGVGEAAGSTTGAVAMDDEAGPRVLELLRRLESPPPTVVVQSPRSQREAARHLNAALRLDAFAVMDRQTANMESMLRVLRRVLERFYDGRWPDGSSLPHRARPERRDDQYFGGGRG